LVIGNEVTGVDDLVLAAADMVLEIPQFGEKESLNVAVAFGIAVYLLLEKLWRE
jgi:tRNA G18 (ribose-2'-O)-methylase SpoU